MKQYEITYQINDHGEDGIETCVVSGDDLYCSPDGGYCAIKQYEDEATRIVAAFWRTISIMEVEEG